MNPIHTARRALQRADDLLRRHPRRLTAAVVALLMGSAVTAFGVAPLAPDAAKLPKSLVTEEVPLGGLDQQLQALEFHPLDLYRSDQTRANDTADTLLRRLGIDDTQVAAFLRSDPVGRRLLDGRAGKMVRAQAQGSRLVSLVARAPAASSDQTATHFTRLTITRDERGGLRSKIEQAPLSSEVRLGSGTILSSLFAAADDSRLPDSVTIQLAELFGADIDFRRDLQRGDTFTVLYEALTADGEPILWQQSGRILAAQFVNAGKKHDAVWFEDPAATGRSRGGYFSLDGRSKNRMFLSSPVAFSRVSSGFAMRMHPVLQTRMAHLGIDYSAPAGTPVRAVGEGSVEFAGWQNGYGNIVILRHAGDRETRYAHLSRLDVKRGQRIEQGQRVGAVGSTGWATGPHLHFEFRVRGQHVDPIKVARESQPVSLSSAARARFAETAGAARLQLAAAPSQGRIGFE